MRALVVAGLLLATMTAGCTTGPAEEQLTISITDVGKQPYVIVIPLWLSNSGPTAEDWIPHGAVHAGQVTEIGLNETDEGIGLRVAGNGTVTIGFEDVRSEYGAGFAYGAHSMGTGFFDLPQMFVAQGDVDVQWFYEGVSEDCFLTGSYTWFAEGPGWHTAQQGGRMSASSDCPTA